MMTGTELQAIRESLKMTQRDFAVAVGLEGVHAHSTINKMERGKRRVNPLIARCAKLLLENVLLRSQRG